MRSGSTTGAVAGFAVDSDVPLQYLRTGGEDRLAVALGPEEFVPTSAPPLREWTPTEENPFHARLWMKGDRVRIWIDGVGWYSVDTAEGRIEIPPVGDPLIREERLWGIPTSVCIVGRGDQTLHAASVEIGGRAVLIAAPGRHGKTTLAAAFHAAGYRVLAEDTACCRYARGEPAILPGPAMLRLRREPYARLDVAGATVLGEDSDRVHLALDSERRGDGGPVPIAGVYLLRIDDEIRLERLDAGSAIPELWALAFKLPTDEDRARCFDAMAMLAGRLPVWNLYRPLTYESLDEVLATISELSSD